MVNGLVYDHPEEFIALFESLNNNNVTNKMVDKSYEVFLQKYSEKR